MTDAPRESAEQAALFEWIHLVERQYPGIELGFAIPNGAFLQGNKIQRAIQWRRLEAQGCRAGVADMCFPVARRGYHGLWIELKRTGATESSVSKEQREFLEAMTQNGYCAVWCSGWVQAAEKLAWYFGSEEVARCL